MGGEVLDLMFRIPGQAVGWLDLVSAPDADPILFGGSVATTDGETRTGISIEVSQELLSSTADLLQQPSESEFILVNDDGTASGYGVTNFQTVSVINDEWELNTGTFTDPDGTAIDFFAATDPVPTIVWIVGIGALACLLKVGIDALVNDCQASMAQAIQECANAGGLPTLTVHTTYGFSNDGGFRIGCGKECRVDCHH